MIVAVAEFDQDIGAAVADGIAAGTAANGDVRGAVINAGVIVAVAEIDCGVAAGIDDAVIACACIERRGVGRNVDERIGSRAAEHCRVLRIIRVCEAIITVIAAHQHAHARVIDRVVTRAAEHCCIVAPIGKCVSAFAPVEQHIARIRITDEHIIARPAMQGCIVAPTIADNIIANAATD